MNLFFQAFVHEMDKMAVKGPALGRMIKSPYLRGESARLLKQKRSFGKRPEAKAMLERWRQAAKAPLSGK